LPAVLSSPEERTARGSAGYRPLAAKSFGVSARFLPWGLIDQASIAAYVS